MSKKVILTLSTRKCRWFLNFCFLLCHFCWSEFPPTVWTQRAPWEYANCTSNMIMSHYAGELISVRVFGSWLPAFLFFLRHNASFRPQQVCSQWTVWASMPVGEPSLSMQGSLPPLFLSVALIPTPSLSILLLFLLFEHALFNTLRFTLVKPNVLSSDLDSNT